MFNTKFGPLLKSGRWTITKLPMIASVAMTKGEAIYAVEDGTHTIVTNSTANFRGILLEDIASTDSDYATSLKMKYVAVPLSDEAEALFDVGAGTFTTADVGKTVKFNDEEGLAVDTAGTQARITKYISSSKGVCTFNLAHS